jgi:hypothetical protein
MASTDFVYNKARVSLNSGAIDLLTATVGAALVTAGYAPNPATDQFLSSIPSAAIVIQSDLTGTGLSAAGSFFGTIPEYFALLNAAFVVALVLYVDTGNPATSNLLYYSSTGPGFPFLPQGFNYVVGYDQNNGGFFQ